MDNFIQVANFGQLLLRFENPLTYAVTLSGDKHLDRVRILTGHGFWSFYI
jgi:hypothetical protein